LEFEGGGADEAEAKYEKRRPKKVRLCGGGDEPEEDQSAAS